MSDTEQVVLYAEFTAAPDAVDEVEELLRDFGRTVRAEPGNVTFDVYRRTDSPASFYVFEIYRDRAAFEEHLAAESGRVFNDALGELIVEAGSELTFLKPAARP
ncbi:MAG: putative quinol monooxygenase [Mycetocola sp.]